jgi:TolB protein
MDQLRAGRSFATNGPILGLTVDGHAPSSEVLDFPSCQRTARIFVEWASALPIDRVEIVRDGVVVAASDGPLPDFGSWALDLDVADAGWVAARCSGAARTSFGHAVWGHTSPVYLRAMASHAQVIASATAFVTDIDLASDWLAAKARFATVAQRTRVQTLFSDARELFARLASGAPPP